MNSLSLTKYSRKESAALRDQGLRLKWLIERDYSIWRHIDRGFDYAEAEEARHRRGRGGSYTIPRTEAARLLVLRAFLRGPGESDWVPGPPIITWEHAAGTRPDIVRAYAAHEMFHNKHGSWAIGILRNAFPDVLAFEYARICP